MKFSVKSVWHCCDLQIQSMSMKVVWMGKAQGVLPSCKVCHLSYLQCQKKKITASKFLPRTDNQPASQPLTIP